jgi:hypothetical protein
VALCPCPPAHRRQGSGSRGSLRFQRRFSSWCPHSDKLDSPKIKRMLSLH